MFQKLKAALSNFREAITHKSVGEEELSRMLEQFELSLFECDVAQEVVAEITSGVKSELSGTKIARSQDLDEVLKKRLTSSIEGVFSKTAPRDLLGEIRAKRARGEPYIVLFLGINGTGKTTSLAKLAYLLRKEGFSITIACADTHRAGAIEQLSKHAERLSIKMVAQRYGADPAAVARDAVLHAVVDKIDVVLIDTAGRMQTSRNLMDEMAKIVRVVKPDIKILVVDSLAGNDAISQAREFLTFTSFDAAILTKADADVKGGAALSVAFVTGKPIVFLGVGQGYGDLVPFDAISFVSSLFENKEGGGR